MTRLSRLAAAASLVGCVLAVSIAAQEPATRSATLVPAPVGPNGQTQNLYSGSYALLVGESRYNTPAAWPSLDSVPGELDTLAAALRDLGFDRIERIDNPTGDELKRGIEAFIERYGYDSDNRLLFFFSGHGYTLRGGQLGFFVPRDAPDPMQDERGFRRVALAMDQVATWARLMSAKHALFAFDSCFSGTIFRTRANSAAERLSQMTSRPVREFLTAGSANQKVPAQSVFTPQIVRGLRGAADLDDDGYVTGTELGVYVQREMLTNANSIQTPQFGKLNDLDFDEGDVVFMVPSSTPRRPTVRGAVPDAPLVVPPPPPPLDPKAAIAQVLNEYKDAYQTMNVDRLRAVYPTFANFPELQRRFADLQSIAVAMGPPQITLLPDGTAVATCLYGMTFTSRTGKNESTKPSRAEFRLRKVGSMWLIDGLSYR